MNELHLNSVKRARPCMHARRFSVAAAASSVGAECTTGTCTNLQIQAGYKVTLLSQWGKKKPKPMPVYTRDLSVDWNSPPSAQVGDDASLGRTMPLGLLHIVAPSQNTYMMPLHETTVPCVIRIGVRTQSIQPLRFQVMTSTCLAKPPEVTTTLPA